MSKNIHVNPQLLFLNQLFTSSNKDNNLLDETLDVDVRDGGFKLGGVLLDVGMEYCVPVVLVTLDGNTVAVLFCETDLYEVDEEVDVELKRTCLVSVVEIQGATRV